MTRPRRTGGQAATHDRARLRPILREALLKAMIGTLIALIGTIVFYVADFRHWGADLTQSVLVQFEGGALGMPPAAGHGDGGAGALGPEPERWAFVDIGPRFCAGAGTRASICPPQTARTDPAALARLLGWVVGQQPRLVVLDIEAVRSLDELAAVRAALPIPSPTRPTPVLIALPYEEGDSTPGGGDDAIVLDDRAMALVEAAGDGPIRFLPTSIRAPVPVARLLMTSVRTTGHAGPSRLPTISFAAAIVARTPGNDPFALIDRLEQGPAAAPGGETPCDQPVSARCQARFAGTERAFSFRPLPAADDPDARVEADLRAGAGLRYFYLPAPAADRIGQAPGAPGLREAVVVIGDSRHAAQDRPWTALGDVSGAELHLNDIRQFSRLHPVPDSLGAYLAGELPLLALGFLAVTAVEALLGLRRRRRPPRPKSSIRYPLASLAGLLLIATVTAIAFLVLLMLHHGHGGPTDFVTPFLGLMVFTALEFFMRFLSWIEARFGLVH